MPFEPQELAKFSQAGRAFATATMNSFETWAMGEMAIVCRQWAGHIPQATPAAAVLRSRARGVRKAKVDTLAAYGLTINTGRKGGEVGLVWYRVPKRFLRAGEVSDLGSVKVSPSRFGENDSSRIATGKHAYASILPGLIAAGQAAIGLARQSVLQIADSLGFDLAASAQAGGGLSGADMAKARTAKASDGRYYLNGYSLKARSNGAFSVTAVNRYPRIAESGVDTALMEVVGQRMAYHEANLALVLNRDTAKIMQAYPYLQIVP